MTSQEKLFQEKLAILNENFLRFMQNARKKTPFADFTPTINDYLRHLAELDKMYTTVSSSATNSVLSFAPLKNSSNLTFGEKPANSAEKNGEVAVSSAPTNSVLSFAPTKNPANLTFGGVSAKPAENNGEEVAVSSAPTNSVLSFAPLKNSSNLTFGLKPTNSAENNGGVAVSSAPTNSVLSFAPTKNPANLTFGGVSAKPAENNGEEENDQDDEPPKPEEVEQVEKDAIISCKCLVYSLKEKSYVKKGVAFAFIKKLDGDKKQLLIREATITGRPWTNTLMNDTLKWQKMDPKKLRLSYPSNTETKDEATSKEKATSKDTSTTAAGAVTILLRFGTDDELTALVKEFESK